MVEKGNWVEVPKAAATHVSRAFLVPKGEPGSGKYRLVIDLRHHNSFCKEQKMRFETLKSLSSWFEPGQEAAFLSFDLADGFGPAQQQQQQTQRRVSRKVRGSSS